MGQFILFLLGMFVICSVLYGIAAGVGAIGRGIASLADWRRNDDELEDDDFATPTTASRHVTEIRALFDLYQDGALTQEEFSAFKQEALKRDHR